MLEAHTADQLVVPGPVAVETAWLIGSRLGPLTEAAFVASIAAGELTVAELTAVDWARCAELIGRYADLGLGLVDASVVATAERLDIGTVAASTDATCSSWRPRHVTAFQLIP